jgi:hypothetical protein
MRQQNHTEVGRGIGSVDRGEAFNVWNIMLEEANDCEDTNRGGNH